MRYPYLDWPLDPKQVQDRDSKALREMIASENEELIRSLGAYFDDVG